MAEPRGDEWLPEGWKMEVRVRRSGKRDRYYTDTVSGYVFRSLKDIDRYILTGEVGRHVMKNKPKDAGCSSAKREADEVPEEASDKKKANFADQPKKAKKASKKRKLDGSDEPEKLQEALEHSKKLEKAAKKRKPDSSDKPKKSCLVAENLNSAGNGEKKQAVGDWKSNEKIKSRKKTQQSSKKEEPNSFFIQKPDQVGEATSGPDRLSLPEIVDLVKEAEETRDYSDYISAPHIAALFGRQMPSEHRPKSANNHPQPPPDAGICDDYYRKVPRLPYGTSETVRCEASPLTGFQGQENHFIKTNKMMLGYLCSDPCIEFAIKTLTGTIDPFVGASDVQTVEDCPTDQTTQEPATVKESN